jgi:membrane protein YdbS with pleckstrin-like domain
MTTQENDPMTGDPQPHKPAEDTEQVYYEGSPLLRGELAKGWIWVLLGLAVLVGTVLWYFRNTSPEGVRPFPWWVLLAAAAVGLLLVLIPWIKTKTVSYKITNYRIDIEQGLVARKIDTMELWHVDDIQLNQGVFERLLGVGTLTVMSDDQSTPQLPLRGLPNPKSLFDSLKQRVIAVKRQRGVIKMDVGN